MDLPPRCNRDRCFDGILHVLNAAPRPLWATGPFVPLLTTSFRGRGVSIRTGCSPRGLGLPALSAQSVSESNRDRERRPVNVVGRSFVSRHFEHGGQGEVPSRLPNRSSAGDGRPCRCRVRRCQVAVERSLIERPIIELPAFSRGPSVREYLLWSVDYFSSCAPSRLA